MILIKVVYNPNIYRYAMNPDGTTHSSSFISHQTIENTKCGESFEDEKGTLYVNFYKT